jgi:hypothetical protein
LPISKFLELRSYNTSDGQPYKFYYIFNQSWMLYNWRYSSIRECSLCTAMVVGYQSNLVFKNIEFHKNLIFWKQGQFTAVYGKRLLHL